MRNTERHGARGCYHLSSPILPLPSITQSSNTVLLPLVHGMMGLDLLEVLRFIIVSTYQLPMRYVSNVSVLRKDIRVYKNRRPVMFHLISCDFSVKVAVDNQHDVNVIHFNFTISALHLQQLHNTAHQLVKNKNNMLAVTC